MLMQGGIQKTTLTNVTQIDAFPQETVAVGIVVDDGNYVTVDGKKIVKAGTPLAGDLTARTTAFVKASTTSTKIGETDETTAADVVADVSDAVGILLHDVDVTNGDANGTLMIGGYVNLDRIDSTTAAYITDEVIAALHRITFIK